MVPRVPALDLIALTTMATMTFATSAIATAASVPSQLVHSNIRWSPPWSVSLAQRTTVREGCLYVRCARSSGQGDGHVVGRLWGVRLGLAATSACLREQPLVTDVSTPTRRHVADTVENAKATPEKEQPYGALGLKPDEYQAIRDILGRRPTSGELAMYSVMWSEHCSYKSSKKYLRQFGQKVSDEMKKNLMVGMGENAGVVDVGEGWAVTFKIESHNHPSYIEPFQGAATGVGGIVRDIISMGARPVAVMDALRFGRIDDPDTARVVHGVVSGISFYGNCLGLPNIGGETWFDPVYQANPLVNALAVGVLRHEDLHLANAPRRRQQGRALRCPHGRRRHRRRLDLGLGLLRRGRPHQAARRAGRRPLRREGTHRVLPRTLQGRARRGHPGPRRRRHLVRDLGARGERRRRHAHPARERAAARPDPHGRGDPHVGEPGAHDGDRAPGEARGLHGRRREVGRRDRACSAR
jgi:hypothetical protein